MKFQLQLADMGMNTINKESSSSETTSEQFFRLQVLERAAFPVFYFCKERENNPPVHVREPIISRVISVVIQKI